MTRNIINPHIWPTVRNILLIIVFILIVALLMMWLMGVFHPKIGKQITEAPKDRPVDNVRLETARIIQVPASETAVGTIRSVHETSVASKLLAKVTTVNVKAGQRISKDEILVKLDDADLAARRNQAAATLDAARAVYSRAKTELSRIEHLYKQNSATQLELDNTRTAYQSAEAEVQRAEQALKEAETVLGYTTIRSPMDGTIVDKKVDAGDTVRPGQVLVNLYDPTRMQLVASVRESLVKRLQVGHSIDVRIDTLSLECKGTVSEIVPQAESTTRTFSVKVTGPCPPGVYAGMFGRLVIPLDVEEVLVIPRSTIRRIGQLDVVDVAEGNVLRRRALQLGRTFGEQVQILSGLSKGERVVVNPDM
ncbi:MAG: efflux RND transporter periplasmic adaptor subunit [Planctomycetota bacterium]|nr:MAG: efflux RND transporter periplasmic adaptor subunit [Planctomycetota bacterium]